MQSVPCADLPTYRYRFSSLFGNHERTDQTEDDGTEGLPYSGFLGLVGTHSITEGDAEYVSNRSRQAGVILYRPPGRLQ